VNAELRACLMDRSEFAVERAPGVKVFRRRDIPTDDMLQLVLSHKDARRARDHRLLKESCRGYVTRVALRSSRDAKPYIVKEERYGPPLRFVLKLFRRSRSMQAWLSGNGFIVRGIPTARPIALIQERFWFVPYRSYLITEYVEGAINVEELPAGHGKDLPGLLPALAEAIADLFNHKVYHSDLSVKNVLARRGDGGEWSFYFIDLDAVSFAKRLTVRRRAKNLAQLDDSLRGVFDGPEVAEFLNRVVELTGGEPMEGFLQLVQDMSTKRRMLREKRQRKRGS
jgi:tRNA A-37 threonylcarbamoyl transferase component Bud32